MEQERITARIRACRQAAGLTLAEAAQRAELNKATLSKIETGRISPPIATLLRVAKALNVAITDFFVDSQATPEYVLTRKGRGIRVESNGSQFGYSYEALAFGRMSKNAEPFYLTIEPTDPPGEFHHQGQEFIYMLSGRMEFTVGNESMILAAGDSLYFNASHLHRTKVLGKRPAKFLCVFIHDA